MASFFNQIGKFAAKAGKNIATAQRKIAFDLAKKVIEETPVATGRAKGNWLPSVGSPDTGTTDALDGTQLHAIGGASIVRLKAQVAGIKGDQTFYLSNNLPYIRKLEYAGHSPQQPGGWVRLAAQDFSRIAKKAAAQL